MHFVYFQLCAPADISAQIIPRHNSTEYTICANSINLNTKRREQYRDFLHHLSIGAEKIPTFRYATTTIFMEFLSGNPALLSLILTHILHLGSVKQPLGLIPPLTVS